MTKNETIILYTLNEALPEKPINSLVKRLVQGFAFRVQHNIVKTAKTKAEEYQASALYYPTLTLYAFWLAVSRNKEIEFAIRKHYFDEIPVKFNDLLEILELDYVLGPQHWIGMNRIEAEEKHNLFIAQ